MKVWLYTVNQRTTEDDGLVGLVWAGPLDVFQKKYSGNAEMLAALERAQKLFYEGSLASYLFEVFTGSGHEILDLNALKNEVGIQQLYRIEVTR